MIDDNLVQRLVAKAKSTGGRVRISNVTSIDITDLFFDSSSSAGWQLYKIGEYGNESGFVYITAVGIWVFQIVYEVVEE